MKCFFFLAMLLYCTIFSLKIGATETNSDFIVVKNSLSANLGLRTIRSALLDDSGQMWVGTQSGLFLFNGSSANGHLNKSNSSGLVWQSDVAAIQRDSKGNIWVLTANDGLYAFKENETGRSLDPQSYGRSLRAAYSLEVTKTHIWVVDAIGIHVIDLVFGLPDPSGSTRTIFKSNNRLTSMLKTKDGRICIGEIREIKCWDTESLKSTREDKLVVSSGNYNVGEITALSLASKGNTLYAGTSNGEIHQVSIDDGNTKFICEISSDTSARVTSITQNSAGSIIGTDNGIFQVPLKGERCPALGVSELKNSHVTNSYNFGDHLWVATYTGIYTLKRSAFFYVSADNSHIDNEVMSFESIPDYGLFVGTYNGLFFKQKQSNEFIEIDLPSQNDQDANKRVMALKSDGLRLWIGLRDGGILWYDFSKNSFIKAPEVLQNFSITTISLANSGSVYIGTYGNGLWYFSNISGEMHIARVELPNDFSNITVIETIDSRSFYISAEYVSSIFCVEKEKWLPCQSYAGSPLRHKSRILSAKRYSGDDKLYIGTQNDGLYRFDFSTHAGWIGEKVDLINHDKESIFSIVEAGDSSLWLSTSYGLIRHYPPEKSSEFYFAQDGLQDNDFNFGASLSSRDGYLYFGGSNGFNYFHPEKLVVERSQPKLYFRDVQVGDAYQTQRFQTNLDLKVQMSPSDYFLRIFFHLPDFINSNGIKYRYKLAPFDPDYIDGGNDGSATYTNIPPGDYVFHVQGANSAGVWNTDGIAMSVRVLPPLWRTWWAYCIYVIGLAAALLLVKKWYDTNVLRIQADEIARERTIAADSALDEMQEQLEAQDSLVRNIRERNIATFDTVANIIQHRSDYVPDELSAEIMRGSSRHVHALALLERSLKYYNDSLFADLHAFTADCLSDLSVAHEFSGSVTTINEVTAELISAEDATLVGIVIHELLSNAFQHAFPDDSHARYLRIVMSYEDAADDSSVKVRLKVQDSGSGIPEGIISEQPGLSLVRQIVDRYRGAMEVATANGTAITITLEMPAVTR